MRPSNWIELGQDEEVEFDVHCKMKKCWANEFLSLLAEMERLGKLGCSRIRGLYCDGDGTGKKYPVDIPTKSEQIYKYLGLQL